MCDVKEQERLITLHSKVDSLLRTLYLPHVRANHSAEFIETMIIKLKAKKARLNAQIQGAKRGENKNA